MHAAGAKRGAVLNKHGLLAGALNAAVRDGDLAANPCGGVTVQRTEERQPVFLNCGEFQVLKASFTDHYKPLVEFLVASGCRFNEAVALRPSDIGVDAATRLISCAAPKKRRSLAMDQFTGSGQEPSHLSFCRDHAMTVVITERVPSRVNQDSPAIRAPAPQ
jgi:hypothetical protein